MPGLHGTPARDVQQMQPACDSRRRCVVRMAAKRSAARAVRKTNQQLMERQACRKGPPAHGVSVRITPPGCMGSVQCSRWQAAAAAWRAACGAAGGKLGGQQACTVHRQQGARCTGSRLEQRNVQSSAITTQCKKPAHLPHDGLERAAALAAAGVRHDAEGAQVVASAHDRQVGGQRVWLAHGHNVRICGGRRRAAKQA